MPASVLTPAMACTLVQRSISLQAPSSADVPLAPIPAAKQASEPAKPARQQDYELHRKRQAAILAKHPEVRELYGNDPRMQYYAYAVVAGILSLAWACRSSYGWAVFLGLVVGPYFNAAILVVIHEATHFLVFETPRANRLLAIFTSFPLIVPISEVFKQHHASHHLWLGTEERDVDIPLRAEIAWVGNSPLRKAVWMTFNIAILSLRSMSKLPVYVNKYLVLNWVVSLGFGAAVLAASRSSFLFLALSLLNSQGLHPANTRQVHEHVYDGDERMRPAGTTNECDHPATYSYYGPANLFTLNVGYHLEHHDFNRIPGTRLPELRRIAGDKWYPSAEAHKGRGLANMVNWVTCPKISLRDFGR